MFKKLLGLQTFDSHLCHPPLVSPDKASLKITYLGTAGFILEDDRRTVVLDPFLSRPNISKSLLRPLQSNTALIKKYIPKADDVLIGHAHYDHILDAPALCHQTGARLIGSHSTCQVGRAAGLPEHQMIETQGRDQIACGDWMVEGLPSKHGIIALGRVIFPGEIKHLPHWPPRIEELKHGQVLNWHVNTGSLTIVHIDSADFINEELAGRQADIVCLCAIGRKHRPNYVKDVVRLLNPKWIIPCHWDTMITPYEAEPDYLPGVDLPGFIEEIRQEGVEPVVMPMRGEIHF